MTPYAEEITMSDTEQLDLTYVEGRQDTKLWAIGAILAALYGVGSLIPVSVFLGVAATISLTLLVAPLFGILLGPWRGGFFGLIGGSIAFLLGGSGGLFQLMPILILAPGISGLLTGLCATPYIKGRWVPGAGLTALYIFAIIALYEIVNYEAWWFMSYYGIALVVALILQLTHTELDFDNFDKNQILRLIPFALIGTITDFSMMTMGAVYILQLPALLFGLVIFPIMLVERTAAIIISAIVVIAVVKAFPEIWGPKNQTTTQGSESKQIEHQQ